MLSSTPFKPHSLPPPFSSTPHPSSQSLRLLPLSGLQLSPPASPAPFPAPKLAFRPPPLRSGPVPAMGSGAVPAAMGLSAAEPGMDRFALVANSMADAAEEVIRKCFRKSFEIVDKDDLSPVTIADRAAEESMVSIILDHFPSHAMYITSPHLFSGDAAEAFARVRGKVKVPLYGCDCYAYALLASGFVDLVVESGLKPYDFLSLVPVIEGAGGLITDWKGQKLHWKASPAAQASSFNALAAGDREIHGQALELLQWQ